MEDEDALYGLPLEDFTPQRDALAKRLRSEGDRAGADRVKRLRKPTVAAWAVNQVVRTQPAAARDLATAGEALREAQAALLGGRGSGADLRAAGERERAAVEELVRAARGLLSGSGASLSESAVQEVEETLHAAALDEDTREAVLAGRLDRVRKASGFGGDLGVLAAPAAAPARTTRGGQPEESRRTPKEDARAAKAAAREELRAARAAAKEAASAAERAERDYARAESRLESAESQLAAAKEARDEARAAERAARRAREQAAKEAERRQAALDRLESGG